MEHELTIISTCYRLFYPRPTTIYFYGDFEAVKARIAKEKALVAHLNGLRKGDYVKFKLSVFANG